MELLAKANLEHLKENVKDNLMAPFQVFNTVQEFGGRFTGEKSIQKTETEEPEPSKKNTGSAGTIIFVIVALLAVGGAGYYVKIVRPKQLAEDDEDFEDGGYGEGFDPDEAFGETEYLSEDDFDDRMDDNEPEDGE